MITYSANWHRNNKFGNAIKSGATLNVKLENAVVCTGQIKKKVWYGWKLMQIAQGVNFIKFNLKKKKRGKTVNYDLGHYQLFVWASDKTHKGFKVKDMFYVD